MKKGVILLAVLLSACATQSELPKAEIKIAERVEYVVRIPDAALLTLPEEPAPVNLDTATQADVARWLLLNEQYVREIKRRLIEVAKFLKREQQVLDDEAKKKNTEAGTISDETKVVEKDKK